MSNTHLDPSRLRAISQFASEDYLALYTSHFTN
jgi:hypothetical protein